MAAIKGMSKGEMEALKTMWTKMSSDERKTFGMAIRNVMGAGKLDDKGMMMRATKGMSEADKKMMSAHWSKMSPVEQSAMKKLMLNTAMGQVKMSTTKSTSKKAG